MQTTEIDKACYWLKVTIMNVSLTPELENWVHSKVKTGLYGSSSEVVRDALRLLYQFEEEKAKKLASLQSELLLGLKQLDKGRSESMDHNFAEKIKRSGRERKHG
ncbi:MAG: type II toxin-antitoxin system ParD family antitoxin [Opitutales bacterium]|nr:type II toxin-antitoxin system ParD family antitoxin [Opitutales bacterium]